jgi:hypothetical protein
LRPNRPRWLWKISGTTSACQQLRSPPHTSPDQRHKVAAWSTGRPATPEHSFPSYLLTNNRLLSTSSLGPKYCVSHLRLCPKPGSARASLRLGVWGYGASDRDWRFEMQTLGSAQPSQPPAERSRTSPWPVQPQPWTITTQPSVPPNPATRTRLVQLSAGSSRATYRRVGPVVSDRRVAEGSHGVGGARDVP